MTDTNDALKQDLADSEWMDYFASDEYVPDRSAEEIDEILGRVARRHRELAETVAKLPVTADGVIATPGMELHAIWNGKVRSGPMAMFNACPTGHYMGPTMCYASKAAAEAAMRGEGPKENGE